MKYEIFGNTLPGVTVTLDKGESIITQSGGMAWMSDDIRMETNMKGGFLKGLARVFSGNSLFIATYTADSDGQEITLASTLPGEIKPLVIDGNHEYIGQKGAFLGSTPDVEISTFTQKSFAGGLFGGEGFILQKFSGEGTAWVELDGSIKEIDLLPGQKIKVDTSNVALFESTVEYDIESIKGFKNVLFGGEGLFLTTLTGPGKVWLQTMTVGDLAQRLIPYLPTQTVSSSDK